MNHPMPASPLPWNIVNNRDISSGNKIVCEAYPNEGGGFEEPSDASYAVWAANNAPKLAERVAELEGLIKTVLNGVENAIYVNDAWWLDYPERGGLDVGALKKAIAPKEAK